MYTEGMKTTNSANDNLARRMTTIRVVAIGRSGRPVRTLTRGRTFRLVATWTTGVESTLAEEFTTLLSAMHHAGKLLTTAAAIGLKA